MASISNDPNGRRRIQFFDANGQRRTIRLGKVPLRYAEAVKVKVEDLAYAASTGHAPAEETSRWLVKLDSELYDKLAKAGLTKPRGATTLGEFTRAYIEGRADIKTSTRINLERVRRYLIDYMGSDRQMRNVTAGDAEDFRQHLIRKFKADNTVRRTIGRSRQFFHAAIQHGLIQANPFKGMAAAVRANAARFYFVSRADSQKVIDACPDTQWKLIFALARFGGLRCPSEILALTWGDVNWEHNRVRVPSPKTERHEGGASRMIPLFPELRPHLLEAFEQAEPGAEHVITRYRDTNANLRTQLHRIIRRAGLDPWPKTFQNLRSTRETELAEEFPMHVVCGWIGNSEPIAAAHYLQTTDEHFDRAVREAVGADAAQNAAQKPTDSERNDPKENRAQGAQADDASADTEKVPAVSGTFESGEVTGVGLAPAGTRRLTTAHLSRYSVHDRCFNTLPSISTCSAWGSGTRRQ